VSNGHFEEGADGGCFARSQYKIIRLLLLQHQPHAAYVVFGVPPIALGVEIGSDIGVAPFKRSSVIFLVLQYLVNIFSVLFVCFFLLIYLIDNTSGLFASF
jgi:hypothetical protein